MPARRLLGLALLASVALLAASCGGSSKSSSPTTNPQPPSVTATGPATGSGGSTSTKTSTSPAPTPTGPQPSSGTPIANHALVVNTGTSRGSLWPVLGGSLLRYAPGQVEGKGIRILSVVGPAVIWVGKSVDNRLLVHIRLKGKSAPKLHKGQTAHFIGQLVKTSSGDAASFGVKDPASLALLKHQGAYVDVSAGDLRVS